ncbi:MAG TPA: contact-dependent growth inhibition system immunity protein [Candidatus Saccharimonadales bacterium]|nr:contact-dependent growth inhibition system immunity protein [Candidatus Saccharimonadales bacterium]
MKREPSQPKPPFDPADYPALREMLPAYLHQDFADEYGSAEKAVQGFLQEASGDEILQVKEDWVRFRRVLKASPLKECQAALGRLGSAWIPQSEADLKRLDEILARAQA